MKISITQNKYIRQTAILFVWLLLWQILYFIIKKDVLIASPLQVAKAFFSLATQHSFWITIIASLFRILAGYLFAIFFGILLAILCFKNKLLHTFLLPAIQAIKATPVVSFSILILLWIKTDFVPIIISFLMVFPIIWTNVFTGICQTNIHYLEMAQVYGFSFFKKCRFIYIPSVMPYFLSACHTSIGLAWKAGIAAEVICTPSISMGKEIYETKIYLETPELFAWTICAIAFSIFLEKIFLKILHFINQRIGLFYESKNNITTS